ncbi:threonine/homoserine/homoserine lactone efflux protein [Rhodobium orientis]|uniref:Lysine transporter LysE n=1 Tax=Rhodobium orientis TaxID=34017 RepID=A0A327JFG0_9HYPH|nr:LysE family translocator [Rhodobium orientis]MBB4303079.1 threonine/homoserine/homoserine lactone efflux protein [Rhodobium orientis]MBK5948290.1 hypothetical protein [Rhodobium orientis]RAI25127.1 hypothetical protein CH339_19505 [Rhodobium orientis]
MITAEQLAFFVPAALLVAASPGANNLLSLTHGIRAGFAVTAISLAGRLAAFLLMIVAVAVGLGAVLAASEAAFTAIKWAGVAYLVYLGVKVFRARELHIEADAGAVTAMGLARREFLVAIMNPKAALLFTAFIPQFVDPANGSFSVQFLALGLVYLATEFTAACGYAAVGSTFRRFDITPRRARAINRTTGSMLLGAATALAFAKRA